MAQPAQRNPALEPDDSTWYETDPALSEEQRKYFRGKKPKEQPTNEPAASSWSTHSIGRVVLITVFIGLVGYLGIRHLTKVANTKPAPRVELDSETKTTGVIMISKAERLAKAVEIKAEWIHGVGTTACFKVVAERGIEAHPYLYLPSEGLEKEWISPRRGGPRVPPWAHEIQGESTLLKVGAKWQARPLRMGGDRIQTNIPTWAASAEPGRYAETEFRVVLPETAPAGSRFVLKFQMEVPDRKIGSDWKVVATLSYDLDTNLPEKEFNEYSKPSS